MSIELKAVTILAFLMITMLCYFGVTKSSDFKKLPKDKQDKSKKNIKIGITFGLVLGIYQIFINY